MRQDLLRLDFLDPYFKIKLLRKRTLKRSLFSRKALEIESLADAQFVIDSCCLVSQVSYLSNSDKDCDWFISARKKLIQATCKDEHWQTNDFI